MATSSTAIEMRLEGVDKSKHIFDKVNERINGLTKTVARADSVLARTGRSLSGAFSADGLASTLRGVRNGLLGVSAAAAAIGYGVKRATAALSELSDRAAQAGTSADYLQRLEMAFQTLGAKGVTIDSITEGLARMTRATGRTGESGLRQTLEEIAALETEGERVSRLAEVFGRSFGPGLAAIVRSGPEAVSESLDDLVQRMPGISDAMVQKADAIADGFGIAGREIKNGWNTAMTEIGDRIASLTGTSAREFGKLFGVQLRYWLQAGVRYVVAFVEDAARVVANFKTVFKIVFGDYLPNLVAEGLMKAWAKIYEWGEKVFIRFKQVFELVKALFTDDTVEDVNKRAQDAIEKSTEKFRDQFDAVSQQFADNTVDNLVNRLRNEAGLKLSVDLSDLQKERDEAMQKAWGIDKAITESAQDRLDDLGKAGAAAAKKTADAWKSAGAIMAGSYEALRVTMQRTSRAASSLLSPASSSASSGSSAATGDLASLLAVQRDGWGMLKSSLSSLGVV